MWLRLNKAGHACRPPTATPICTGTTTSNVGMVNHAKGDIIWDILVTVAAIGPFAIMPTGCPACVTEESMLADLPPPIEEDARVISSGSELLRVIANG